MEGLFFMRKTNLISELKSHTNLLLSGSIGVALAFLTFLMDKFNLLSDILMKVGANLDTSSAVRYTFYGVSLALIVVVLVLIATKMFKNSLQKTDSLLVVYDFFTLTMFLTYAIGLGEGATKIIVTGCLFLLAILLTIVRWVKVTEETDYTSSTAQYRVAVVSKYSLEVLVLTGIAVGIGFGLLCHYTNLSVALGNMFDFWKNSDRVQKTTIVSCVFGGIFLVINLYTLIARKKSKVNWLDATLIVLAVASFFSGLYFALSTTAVPHFKYYIWFGVMIALAGTILLRALLVNTEHDENKELNRLGLYEVTVAKHTPLTFILFVAGLVSLSLNRLDAKGLANAFATGANTFFTLVGFVGLASLIVIGIISLFKDKLTSNKVIALDSVIVAALVMGGMMILALLKEYSLVKLIIWLIAMVATLVIFVLRVMKHQFAMAGEELPAVEENEETEEIEEPIAEEILEETDAEVDDSEHVETIDETEEEAEDEELPVEEESNNEEIIDVPTDKLVIRRTKFINKMKFTSDKTKEYYSQIKNLLLSYGTKNKVARRNEAFRKSGLVAKISISGKSLRLHLPLDPNDEERFPTSKYHQISLANKKQYNEVPFTLKIKSDRALKRALELIELVCLEKPLKKKRKYEETDFTKDLQVDGEAIFEKLGLLDEMTDNVNKEYIDNFEANHMDDIDAIVQLLPKINKVEPNEGETQNIYIDTVLDKIEGDVINLDSLKKANLISLSTNNICVKIHENLNKPITVECDEITSDAVVAVLAVNGKIFLKR
jgi:membrane protein